MLLSDRNLINMIFLLIIGQIVYLDTKPFTMKTFVLNMIRDIQDYSERLDNTFLLTNYHWVMLDELSGLKTTYFFRQNGELIISLNGKVERAQWEYLDPTSILIDLRKQSYLFRHGFFDENILALKIDGKNEYAIFINESKYDQELNNLDAVSTFLNKYFLHQFLSPHALMHRDENVIDKRFIKDGYTFKMGWFKEYGITFAGGTQINIYQKISNGKYFVYDKKHILLFENKQDCLKYLEMELPKAG